MRKEPLNSAAATQNGFAASRRKGMMLRKDAADGAVCLHVGCGVGAACLVQDRSSMGLHVQFGDTG